MTTSRGVVSAGLRITRCKLHACRSAFVKRVTAISPRLAGEFLAIRPDGAGRSRRACTTSTTRGDGRPGRRRCAGPRRAAAAQCGTRSGAFDPRSRRRVRRGDRAARQHRHPVAVGDGPDQQQHVVGLPAHPRLESAARHAARTARPQAASSGGITHSASASSARAPARRPAVRRRAHDHERLGVQLAHHRRIGQRERHVVVLVDDREVDVTGSSRPEAALGLGRGHRDLDRRRVVAQGPHARRTRRSRRRWPRTATAPARRRSRPAGPGRRGPRPARRAPGRPARPAPARPRSARRLAASGRPARCRSRARARRAAATPPTASARRHGRPPRSTRAGRPRATGAAGRRPAGCRPATGHKHNLRHILASHKTQASEEFSCHARPTAPRRSCRRDPRRSCAGSGVARPLAGRRRPGRPHARSPAASSPGCRRTPPPTSPTIVGAAHEAFRAVAHGAGAGARRARARARRAAARAQGRPRRAGVHRGRQDPLRGPRRGAGDDRHLRPRRRPVAPAVRPDDRLRAARPPDDGAVAPARGRRRHQRLQLPGRGLVVERRARAGLRRPGRVEAVGEDAADRAGLPGAADRGGAPGRRAARRSQPSSLGGAEVGEALVDDPRVALVSATGSTRMGRAVAPRVAGRFGRLLLELGGNNAAIVAPSADLDLAVRGIVFSAAGTAGQRCTSLRRVIAHASIVDELVARLAAAYETLPIGSPLDDGHAGRPADRRAPPTTGYVAALDKARANGGERARRRRARARRRRGRTPTTSSRRWCGCRRSRRSCRPRRSRRSCTC